jgi:hypothetical protein
MKKTLFVLMTLGFFLLLLTSCNKEDELNEIATAEDMTLIEDIFNSIDETADEQTFGFTAEAELETRSNPCVVITSTAPLGQYPNTFTLDHGDGCEGPHGRIRTGIITIEVTGDMALEGSTRTVSFQDFFVDGVQVLGTHILTNTGLNANGLQTFTKEAAATQLVFPNGDTATRDAFHTLTFLEGFDTQIRFDNVLAIEGDASGISRAGVNFAVVIVEPLIKRGNCRWITEGIKEITRDEETISLDYGDGACNGVAMVTFADGTTKEINMYRRWWK